MFSLKRFLGFFIMVSLVALWLPTQGSAAFGDNLPSQITADNFLSAEYILLTNDKSEFWRLGLVALTVNGVERAGGAFYRKGDVGPYVDSYVLGDITAGDTADTYIFTGQWYWGNPDTPQGDLVINFRMNDLGVPIGEGYWTVYSEDSETEAIQTDFSLVESGRSIYSTKEAQELATLVQSCLNGATTCTLGQNPEELTPELVFDGEYVITDGANNKGLRLGLMYVPDEDLSAYGLDPTYNTIGAFWGRGEIPVLDSVLVGHAYTIKGGELMFQDYRGNVAVNNLTVEQTLIFDGVWFYPSGTVASDYQDNHLLDNADTYGGEIHANFRQSAYSVDSSGNIIYVVTSDGYWTEDGYSINFVGAESGRSRYAKHELNDLKEQILTYLAQVDDGSTEEANQNTEDPPVDIENTDQVSDEEATQEDQLNSDQEDYVEETFEDVDSSDWYAPSISSSYWSGMPCVNGNGQCFNGDQPVIRAQAAKLVRAVMDYRGLISDTQTCVNQYKDVPQSEWYAEPACDLNTLGIMTGTDNQTFDPTGTLNRAQAATVIARALGGSEMLLSYYQNILGESCSASVFKDLTDTTSWYYDTARLMGCMGIITGVPHDDGSYFEANTVVNRAQFAAMLSRATLYNSHLYNKTLYPASETTYPYLVLVSKSDVTTSSTCEMYPGPDVDSVTIIKKEATVSYLFSPVTWVLKNDNRCNRHDGIQAMVNAPDYSSSGEFGYTSLGSGFAVFETDVDLATDVDGIIVNEVGDSTENVDIYAASDPGNPSTWVYLGQNSIEGDISF